MIFLRSLLFQVYFIGLTLGMGVCAFVIRWFAPHYALTYAKKWTALSLSGLKKICRIDVSIQGLEHLPLDHPFLVASQHQSAFDTLVWMNILPHPAYIMKQELTKIPLLGPMLLLAGMIPVDRKGGPKVLRHLNVNVEKAASEGRQIIIFPEGTRTAFGERVKLQPGIASLAHHTNLPVFPVVTNSGLFWPSQGVMKYPGKIEIIIAPSLPPLARKDIVRRIEDSWRVAEDAFVSTSDTPSSFADEAQY